METAGYFASLFIGLSLGMIGGGGSVLTVPILVYFFKIEPILATAYSLFIVGATSAVGAVQKWIKKEVNFGVVFIFGLPSLITVYLIRQFLVPAIPDIIYQDNVILIQKGSLTLVLFAILMLIASIGILNPQEIKRPVLPKTQGLILLGISVGSSLLIIALNSLVGFTGDLVHHTFDWTKLLSITVLGISGTFIGNWLSGRLPASGIKKIFGLFILLTGLFILGIELFN